MIKALFTVLLSFLISFSQFPQGKSISKDVNSYFPRYHPDEKFPESDEDQKDSTSEKPNETKKPVLLNLKADNNTNEVILTWTLKNGSRIVVLKVEKISGEKRTSVAELKTNSYNDFSSEFIQADLLTEEELKTDLIIYRISGTDSSGNLVLQKQIPVYPSKQADFELLQNYPNPFNPVTTIKFELFSQKYVTLKVFNILGNQIGVFVDEMLPAGNHEVGFDGSNLTSGVYLYTIQIDKYTETKRMILMK